MNDLRAIALEAYNRNGWLMEPSNTAKSFLPFGEIGAWDMTAQTLEEAVAQMLPRRLADAFGVAAETVGLKMQVDTSADTTLSCYATLYVPFIDGDGDENEIAIALRFSDHANHRESDRDFLNVAPGATGYLDLLDALPTARGFDDNGEYFATMTIAGDLVRFDY